MQKPGFWKDKSKSVEISKEAADLKEEIGKYEYFIKEINALEQLSRLAEQDNKLKKEIEESYRRLSSELKKEEIKVFFSGKYDKNDAIMEIYAGAGGLDAQDWATMLLRMYQRYCATKNFQTEIIHQVFGEGVGPEGRIGTKSVTLEINGKYAYGFLRREAGVHRLVRQSPFSAKKLRHTSFALVNVLPVFREEEPKIKIKPEDLKIEFFRASGPGGQYVNRRETAVRITHLPTKITVSCQSERLQGLNKKKAMEVLLAKLYQLEEKKQEEKLKELKGEKPSAGWGNQIRSYILHPYKLVKDLRTGVETTEVERVLDGNLDEFIFAEIKKLK